MNPFPRPPRSRCRPETALRAFHGRLAGPPSGWSIAVVILTVLGWCGGLRAVSALEWRTAPAGRVAELTVAPGAAPGWVRVDPARAGVTFTNFIAVDRFTTNQIYLNGSGVCAGDIDGDGWTDLFFAGLGGRSTLYRNLGDWRFEDVTEPAGVAAVCRPLDASGAAFADFDGDGDLDLVVNSTGGGTHGLLNDGHGRFTSGFRVNPARGGTSLALADLDGDGDLDLYVANYRPETLRDQPRTNFRIERTNGVFFVKLVNGRPTDTPDLAGRFTYLASGSIVENGEPDAVYRNEGAGRFSPIAFTGGAFLDEEGRPLAGPLYDWGLSVMLRDLTGDGLPDIYVCNDFSSPDRFWINQGQGRFRLAPPLALRNTSKFSMGVDAADINRDGHDDLYVLDMMSRDHVLRLTRMDTTMDGSPIGAIDARPQLARSTLHLARGDGTFAEIAQYAGLEATEWSWCPLFVDVDLDGFEDLLMATGHARDDMHMDYGMRIEAMRKSTRMSILDELGLRKSTPAFPFRCLAFRNRGDLHFDFVPEGWGCGEVEAISQGTCLADLDNDGDQDLAVNRMNGVAGLYRNAGSAPRIAVRLKGLPPNTRGLGARLELTGGPVPRQSQEMVCGGRYLSSDDPLRVFAAGPESATRRLEVHWRSGRRSILESVQANRIYEIDEASATPPAGAALAGAATTAPGAATHVPAAGPAPTLFADASERLGHRHYEAPFDDFERQPLLHRRLSQDGPGIGWMDLNGDGRDDLFIGAGRGGRPGIFLNDGHGGFQIVEAELAPRDQTGVVGWSPPSGPDRALVAATGYEEPAGSGAAAVLTGTAAPSLSEAISLPGDSLGPLALADGDGDGDLDLFVGGRALAGRYPEASPSRLFEWRSGRWEPSPTNNAALAGAGLVSGAVWSDLDGDGFPELALACEWGPIRVYRNQRGLLREATAELGLASLTGWWTGISAGDLDGDGRLDLVAGNWGRNSRYRPTRDHPVRLYYGDLARQGQVELIESSFDPGLDRWVPERDLRPMSRQLPWLQERFPRHQDFARAGVEDLLAGRDVTPRHLDAAVLDSMILLNRGSRFEPVPLPPAAQLAPAIGVNIVDFDLDGHLDVFVSQNFHAVCSAISRQDAGRGLLLLGSGDGRFEPVDARRSGIAVYGEQRGSATGDFNGDGRPDLVVTQNGAATRLFRNQSAAPGIGVRFRGPPGNPHAIGVVVRRRDAGGPIGPAQELHAGSGFGSHDAPVLFLPRASAPTSLEVRWPGGGSQSVPLPNPAGSDSGTVVIAIPKPQP